MPKLLVLTEIHNGQPDPASRAAIKFAQEWSALAGGSFSLLQFIAPGGTPSNSIASFGADKLLVMESSVFEHPSGECGGHAVAHAAKSIGADCVAAGSTSLGKELLPRVAVELGIPMLSDVLAVSADDGEILFRRPLFAGNVLADVHVDGGQTVFSIRGTAFGAPESGSNSSPVETLEPPSDWPASSTWVKSEVSDSARPDLTAARVVVSGGRPLGTAQKFEEIIGGLADKLGGAVGATRAAVDAGIAPNELQVGQTGKTVAPDLYIAAGISGSVQHMAGMKESKVIVAINTDSDAPIFEVADYGLVADLFVAVPELTSKLAG